MDDEAGLSFSITADVKMRNVDFVPGCKLLEYIMVPGGNGMVQVILG